MESKRNINILVVDDDAASQELAVHNISFFSDEKRIYRASNAIEMMRIVAAVPIDLAFLDIELNDSDGFHVAEYLVNTQPAAKYVFLTGHTEMGAKSYEYDPIDFLCKPVNVLRLQKTFERFDRARAVQLPTEQIAVETNTDLVLISPTSILFVSRDKRKTIVHCLQQDYTVKSTLEELELMFADYRLVRCHQSFMIALDHVISTEKSSFGRTYIAVLDHGERIPVSRSKFPIIRDHLTRKGLIR